MKVEDRSKSTGGLEETPENLHTVAGFGALYDGYARKIWTHIFVRIRLREEANDLTSQVFFKTWEYVKNGKSIRNVKSFLYRTADNAIIDWHRTAHVHVSIDERLEAAGDEPSYLEFFEEKAVAKEDAKQVYRALATLPEKERSLLLMRFVEELDIREIAQALDKTEGAINVALHRALKNLHQHLS